MAAQRERKLLFFDIDGTLAMPGSPPSQTVVEAIRAARANGHLTILSTGRPAYLVPPEIDAIGFDGHIYSAGGRVAAGDALLFDRPMPGELSRMALDAIREEGLFYTLECVGTGFQHLPPVIRRLMPEGLPAGDYRGEHVYKISFFTRSVEAVDRLRQRLGSRVKLVCFGNMVKEVPFLAGEISAPDVDKGGALRLLCRYYGASPADCVAFGDSMNDAEILESAGLGIAMGNAEAAVKRLADQVCESCDGDGVAKALARLGLI